MKIRCIFIFFFLFLQIKPLSIEYQWQIVINDPWSRKFLQQKVPHIEIYSFTYTSLIDMINLRGDKYLSLSNLDSYKHGNTFHEEDDRIANFDRLYKLPPYLGFEPALPGDRTCQWEGNTLFVYRGTLVAGLRFPFHDFISCLLVYVQVKP